MYAAASARVHSWRPGARPGRHNAHDDQWRHAREHTGAGGGIAVLVEAFRQLMGKAGERQVAGAVNAVETASGGTWMDSHVTVLSKEPG